MSEKIKIEEFVNNYHNAIDDKKKFELLEGVITRTYAPILEKRFVLDKLVEKSIYTFNGIKYIDLVVSKINIPLAIVMLYTNLDISKSTDLNDNAFNDYDLLKQHDLLNAISTYIGEPEIKELCSIYELIVESFYEKNKNIYEYSLNIFSKFMSLFEKVSDDLSTKMINFVNEEKLKEVMGEAK